jgi:leader peptidase (prepilin peptidase)/N-methyltransferase
MVIGSLAPVAIVAAASIPAGLLVSVVVVRESATSNLRTVAMVTASVAIGVWAALVMPTVWLLGATLALGWTLLALGLVDLFAFRLPDILTLPLTAAGLLLSLWLPDHDPLAHLVGAAVGFLVLYLIAIIYRRVRAREGLGLGDAKLAAAAGAWLGWQVLPLVILVASVAGLLWVAVGVCFRGRRALDEQVPFGVPLCIAFWFEWLFLNNALF